MRPTSLLGLHDRAIDTPNSCTRVSRTRLGASIEYVTSTSRGTRPFPSLLPMWFLSGFPCGGHIRFGQPKTAAARRAVSIPAWLPEVIDQHLATYPPGSDGLIFTAPEGGPIRRNTFRSRFWLPAVADSVGQPMRFHDLRHSHVALLIAQGAHPAVIASRLGHTSVKTVLDVYGHLYEGLDRNAADTLEPPWSGSGVDASWSRRNRHRDQGRGLT